MASSLNRIFSKKNFSVSNREEEFKGFASEGSDTESVMEEDPVSDSDEDENCGSRKKGVAPAAGSIDDGEKVHRNPTRRPNPKISNRNALLARENRRRKKERLEHLEKEVEGLRDDNGRIRKLLKKKDLLVKQLTQERNYLKSVIANRTGIMAILKSIQSTSRFPMTSSMMSFVKTGEQPDGQSLIGRKISRSSSDEGLGASPIYQMPLDNDERQFVLKESKNSQSLSPTRCVEGGFVPSHPYHTSNGTEPNNNHNDLGTVVSDSTTVVAQQLPAYEDEFSHLPDMDELLATLDHSQHRQNSQVVLQETSRHRTLEAAFVSTSYPADEYRWSSVQHVR
ncbi:uncharacterized protein LOC129738555 isoform X2 [Uranotaenia lowii]|uniref:uncharacterized protein LOC129738555 isoform X2 n=1 Tax=Uranotaenia lowii TaxID=190385 RepID=UPI00247AB12C|nr:uncharacterized protein LOC129738555 isoform X2 [Uranotaenia lowii]XP_055585753.1 uncharacterized protein LOC129738555 isoform X2 [Uranotaenia lowii]